MSIRVKVEDKPKYKVVEANYRKAIERIIVSGVQNTMNTAKQSIQQHGSSGKTYEKYSREERTLHLLLETLQIPIQVF